MSHNIRSIETQDQAIRGAIYRTAKSVGKCPAWCTPEAWNDHVLHIVTNHHRDADPAIVQAIISSAVR